MSHTLEYAQQKFGLAYSNAKSLHVRDAKRGTLVEVTDSANEEENDPTALPLTRNLIFIALLVSSSHTFPSCLLLTTP